MASNLDAAGRSEVLEGLVYRGTRYVVALITPAVFDGDDLAKPLISGWLGPAFENQAVNAAILVSPWLLIVTATMADNVLVARGLLPKRLPWVIALTVENLVLERDPRALPRHSRGGPWHGNPLPPRLSLPHAAACPGEHRLVAGPVATGCATDVPVADHPGGNRRIGASNAAGGLALWDRGRRRGGLLRLLARLPRCERARAQRRSWPR